MPRTMQIQNPNEDCDGDWPKLVWLVCVRAFRLRGICLERTRESMPHSLLGTSKFSRAVWVSFVARGLAV